MDIQITNENGKKIGELILKDYIQVAGSPIKADLYYVTYTLVLGSGNVPGSFSNLFITNKDFLFITELEIEKIGNLEGLLKTSKLQQIDINSKQQKTLVSISQGYIYPIKIENNCIVYQKETKGFSARFEYDQEIKPF